MKLKLDAIQSKYMPLTMQGQPAQQPVLKIVAGDFEATTSRVEKDGADFIFPEAFQLDVNEAEYINNSLQLEVEAYDFVNNEYVYIGKGSAVLSFLLPVNSLNIALYFHLDLIAYDPRFEGPRQCEVHMRGLVSDKDPIEEELAAKTAELESVKNSFADYATSAKALEAEMENALEMAQAKILKLSKKNTTTTEKYNELTDTYNSLTEELTRLQIENENLKIELRNKSRVNDANASYITINEELSVKVTSLTTTVETYRLQIEKFTKEKTSMQSEMDELYTSRYETELKHADYVSQLQTEISRLQASQGDSKLIHDMSSRIDEMTAEISALKAKLASSAITVNSTFISNTNINNTVVNNSFFETIINSTNETNVFITNIIRSGNVDKIRDALINQMRLYDELKTKNLKLLGKIQQLQANVQVCVRVRPPSDAETNDGGKLCVDASDPSNVYLYDSASSEWLMYEVDAVWGYDHSQTDVFADVEPLVGTVAEGRNACVMAYGDASAGKSFTMSGFGEYLGVKYRSILKLFEILDLKQKNAQGKDTATPSPLSYKVEMSVLSVSKEQVFDLLANGRGAPPSSTSVTTTKPALYDPLTLTYDTTAEDVLLPGLTVQTVGSASEAMQTYARAYLAASQGTGTGNVPAHTHVVLQLTITVVKDPHSSPVTGRLNLVDLASRDTSLTDADKANKGLTALRAVMTALSNNTAPNKVPFDTSALTTLLRPSLSGQSKSMLVVNLCPTDLHFTSTSEQLKFATMVRSIKIESSGGGRSASSALEVKNMESRVRTMNTELTETRQRTVLIERNYEETKKAAQELVSQLNEHATGIANKYQEEKEQNRLLAGDLELTQRNMKKTLDQLKEQLAINERLMGVIKVFEEQQKKTERERERLRNSHNSPMNSSTNSMNSGIATN